MGLARPGDEEQVVQHERDEREARRDYRRDMRRTAVHLALSVTVGLGLIGWSWHSTDETIAPTLWLVGQGTWLCGVICSLLAAYRRGHARGDW